MNIGPLRERLTLNQITTAKGTDGYLTPTVTPLETVWAKVDFEQGTRKTDSGQIVEDQPYIITIRYRDDLTGTSDKELTKQFTLTWNSLTLIIHGIKYIDIKRRFIQLKCYGQD